jgi:hypothetical protein
VSSWDQIAFDDTPAAIRSRILPLSSSTGTDAPDSQTYSRIPSVGGRQSQKLTHDIRKAHVDVCFNTRVVAYRWRLIDAIENGEVDIDASAVGDQYGILS